MNFATKNSCILILAVSEINYIYTKNKSKKFLYLNSGISLAIEKIANFYEEQKIPIYVAVDKDQEIPEYQVFENLNFIKIAKSDSIFETLKIAIYEINNFNYENILINPIHVIPSEILKNETISSSKSLFRRGSWTGIEIKKNKIEFIYRDDKLNEGKLSYAFTGRINANISHIKDFLILSNSLKLNDLGYLAEFLYKKFNYKIHHEIWYDLSHGQLLTKTKLKNITSRNFNSITYCEEKNLITKINTNRDLCSDQISYYKKLNNNINIRRFFPNLLKVISSKEIESYTIEYCPFPNLGELFLHECLDHYIWEKIIKRLKNIYDELYLNPKGISRLNSKDFFSAKLLKREESLIKFFSMDKYSILEKIYFKPYIVNSIQMPPLQNTFRNLSKVLSKFEVDSKLFFGHGDLCFNNILIDPYSLTIKLIDPKASNSLGEKYIGFVPGNYDLAKLNHSFIGLYDSIIAKLYSIKICNDNSYKLSIFHPNKYLFITEIFEQIFFGNQKKLICDINLITSSLFLSMLPLHSEDPKRMLTLAIIGNAIFESYENFSSKIFE